MNDLNSAQQTFFPDSDVLVMPPIWPPYGTSPDGYKLWFDRVYTGLYRMFWLKEGPWRRLAVTMGIVISVFLIGLLIAISANLLSAVIDGGTITDQTISGPSQLYLHTLGVYILCLDVGYSMHFCRQLSIQYHVEANKVRACFSFSDKEFQTRAREVAKDAAHSHLFWVWFGVITVVACAYYLIVSSAIAPEPIATVLDVVYPHAVPRIWRDLFPSSATAVVLFFAFLVILVSATAVQISTTIPRFCKEMMKAATTTESAIQPLPSLIQERFDGLLDLSLFGVLLFAGGVGFLALMYRAQLDWFGILFLSATSIQAFWSFIRPRQYVRKLLKLARFRLLYSIVTIPAQREGGVVPARVTDQLRDLRAEPLSELEVTSELMRNEVATSSRALRFFGVFAAIITQAVPLAILLANSLGLQNILETTSSAVPLLSPFLAWIIALLQSLY